MINVVYILRIALSLAVFAVLALHKLKSKHIYTIRIGIALRFTMCLHKSTGSPANNLMDSLDFGDFEDSCDYDALNKSIENDDSDLSVIQLNIRGLNSKLGDLKYLIDNSFRHQEPNIILLCETWLKSNSPRPNIPGYTLERNDRKRKQGGGVGILISVKNNYKRRPDLETFGDSIMESCFIELESNKNNLIIGSLYRPPNTPAPEFVERFNSLLATVERENKSMILGLDHNMDMLKQRSHKQTRLFLESIYTHGLVPLITKPTRISQNTATLIDNILTSQKLTGSSRQGIICDHTSDHLPCYALFDNINLKKKEDIMIKSRDMRKGNMDALKRKLAEGILLPPLELNINDQFDYFHDQLLKTIDNYIPLVDRKINHRSIRRERWLTAGLLRSIKKCKTLYNKYVRNRSDKCLFEKYTRYNNLLQKTKRHAKKSYYHDQCTTHKSNVKKLWQTINYVIRKTNNKTETIDKLKINNIAEYRGEVIAEELAKYFANVGKTYADRINPPRCSETDYLNQIPRNMSTIYLTPVSSTEIEKILRTLQPKTSYGTDCISNKLLKEIGSFVIEPLQLIFNKSLELGIFPDRMKIAKVIPLFKNKSRELASNYRPISLLLTLSKILEKIMYTRVYNFLDQTNQLYISQYGFRKRHACEHAVGELVSQIVKGLEEGKQTAAVFLDLSKAFDTLSHNSVLLKLERYGLRGKCADWFRSYLSDRKLLVSCKTDDLSGESESKVHSVEYGAPQGSCLGPLIFLIYCNDLQIHLLYLSCIQFADDTTLYISHFKLSYMTFALNHDLDVLQDWFWANKLTLNVNKSVCILFSRSPNPNLLELEINGEPIPQTDCTKFLGLWIDQNLNWKEHINCLIIKLSRNVNLLKMGKSFLTPDTQKVVYYAQIHSNLAYGLSVWGSMAPKGSLHKIQTIQNSSVSLINGNNAVRENFSKYKILNVEQTIELEVCKLWHKHHLKILPPKLSREMTYNHVNKSLKKNHHYMTRNKHLTNVAMARSKLYSTSFLVNGNVSYSKHTDLLDVRTASAYSRKLKNKLLKY